MLSEIVARRLALAARPATPAFRDEEMVIRCTFLLQRPMGRRAEYARRIKALLILEIRGSHTLSRRTTISMRLFRIAIGSEVTGILSPKPTILRERGASRPPASKRPRIRSARATA